MTGATLLAWQQRLGFSQVEAAGHLGVPVQTYRNWLHARYPVPPPIARLCAYIGAHGLLPVALLQDS